MVIIRFLMRGFGARQSSSFKVPEYIEPLFDEDEGDLLDEDDIPLEPE